MKIISTLVILFFSMWVSAAPPLNNIVVFGDSLSDNGNLYEYLKHQLPLSPPYFNGRFSNGPVWVEHLIRYYYPMNAKDHLLDYAFGGAGVLEDDDGDAMFTLRRELNSYFLAHQEKADERSLYVMWIGSNNYLGVPDDVEQSVSDVILGIEHALQRLVKNGAKHILVVNVPDLGRTPAAKEFDAVATLTYLSRRHNDLLEKLIQNFKAHHPEIQWIYFDVNVVFEDVFDKPLYYGFTNITDTCYEAIIPNKSSKRFGVLKMASFIQPKMGKDVCNGYLFFDPVHPTEPVHLLMAERTKMLLDNEGIEFED